ncbi:hypothetical protein T440DRAFT_187409 [Plenodomus tracheiphilus IPT5]|uniref:Uncharacterized protein n=1 Tax=Plenodomus tracheiphilus IPT5 TaxID=1408161 RepID=A0A6A7B087_9PLEO|nr:hypothetical protein T440DRAFT_187409 [Plenodomus tracheiphilus IPT5]
MHGPPPPMHGVKDVAQRVNFAPLKDQLTCVRHDQFPKFGTAAETAPTALKIMIFDALRTFMGLLASWVLSSAYSELIVTTIPAYTMDRSHHWRCLEQFLGRISIVRCHLTVFACQIRWTS